MEYGSRIRFALLTIGGILLLVLSIWGITALAHRLIKNGVSDTTTTTVKRVNLADYNKQSSFVRVTVEGPVVASEKYQSYQIEVGQNFRDLKIFTGYNKQVSTEKQYTNDATAYNTFLKALKNENFTAKNSTYGDDETGYCPNGNRYIYELVDQGEVVNRAWFTTCGFGTFSGLGPATRSLFKAQIPDFTALTSNISL